MNIRKFFIAVLLTVNFTVSCAQENITSPMYSNAKYPLVTKSAFNVLQELHYNKLPLNNDLSSLFHDTYLNNLDPAKMFFSKKEVNDFEKFRFTWVDNIRDGKIDNAFKMHRTMLELVDKRFEFIESILPTIADADFSKQEFLETDRKKADFEENSDKLDDLWQRKLKDDYLRLLLNNNEPSKISATLTRRYNNQKRFFAKNKDEDIFTLFLNSFVSLYDPHTNYLSPNDAENFDINMSLSLDGIGATLSSDGEYTKIVQLIPGSPAYKSNELDVGDRIIAISQNNQDWTDIVNLRLDDVVKLIRGKKGTAVHLEVIPVNSINETITKKISLVRDTVKLEEQAAQKFTINTNNYNISVIKIPTFYMDFKAYSQKNKDYKSTTKDVVKILQEIETDNTDGLIIDLRNNGGGSLAETVNLLNVFLGKVPVVQIKSQNGRIEIQGGSKNAGLAYNKPILVLVNRLSASASEIFAAAMQDYNAALIAGSTTYGKGTVQTIQELDHGELKFTIAKFYRVSGDSTQLKGVEPDIHFPDIVNKKDIGENSYPQALKFDKINSVYRLYQQYDAHEIDYLINNHQNRIQQDPAFIYQVQLNEINQHLEQNTILPLEIKERTAFVNDINSKTLEIENRYRQAKGLQPLEHLNQDEARPKKYDINDDAYLLEAAKILVDKIELDSVQ